MKQEFSNGDLQLSGGEVATLTLSRPASRNAMTREMWGAMSDICDWIEAAGTRVLIVTGQGDRAFCAGADISEFETVYGSAKATADYNRTVRAAQQRLRDLACPTIAAISGACYGGGCGLALACDFRVADESAKFAITPARLGLAYSPADTWQLMEKVGAARAKDLLLTGRAVGADEALSIGLIDRIDTDNGQALAEDLAELAPGALAAIKAIVNGLSLPETSPELQAIFDARFDSAEFREGYSAFLEKRAPDFRTGDT